MERTELKLTPELKAVLELLAVNAEVGVGPLIEDAMWRIPEVVNMAAAMKIKRTSRRERGHRGHEDVMAPKDHQQLFIEKPNMVTDSSKLASVVKMSKRAVFCCRSNEFTTIKSLWKMSDLLLAANMAGYVYITTPDSIKAGYGVAFYNADCLLFVATDPDKVAELRNSL